MRTKYRLTKHYANGSTLVAATGSMKSVDQAVRRITFGAPDESTWQRYRGAVVGAVIEMIESEKYVDDEGFTVTRQRTMTVTSVGQLVDQ